MKVGNVILVTPKILQMDALAKKARKEINKARLTVDDILADLDRQRKRYNLEYQTSSEEIGSSVCAVPNLDPSRVS